MYVCMYVWSSHIAEYGSTGKAANPARGQLNREKNIPLSPCVPENLVSRDGFSRPVPRQPAHLHTQADSSSAVSPAPLMCVSKYIHIYCFFSFLFLYCKKAKTGLRHAVVCPNVTERTKERIAQSKRARAGSLALPC